MRIFRGRAHLTAVAACAVAGSFFLGSCSEPASGPKRSVGVDSSPSASADPTESPSTKPTEEPTEEPTTTTPTPTAPSGDVAAFCAAAGTIVDGTYLSGVDYTNLDGIADEMQREIGTLHAVTAPPEVADDWQAMLAVLDTMVERTREFDFTTQEGLDGYLEMVTEVFSTPEVIDAGLRIDEFMAESC